MRKLLFALIAGSMSVWAQDEETIASFAPDSNEGWTINNAEFATAGGGYYKLTSSDASIVTPSINWSNYEDITITISARKFGGPDATQGKISVSQGTKELASYSPAGTSIASSGALSIEPTDGTITISCPGASSGKGCGVQSIVIKGTPSSGTPKTPIATIGDISLSEIEIGEGTIPLAGLLAYITFAEGKTVTDCVPTIASDNTSVLEISISGTNLAYNAKKAGQATLTLTLTPTDTENYSAVSKQLTVTVVDPNAGNESWVLTDLAALTESDVFVIVGNNGANYAMSNDKGTTAAPTAVSVTVSDNKLTGTIADNIKWNISGNATDGYTFYPDGSTTTWLYCTSDNNGVRVGTTNSNDYDKFKINSNYIYNIGRARYLGIYSSSDWRCYTSINSNISGQSFAFYKKVTGDVLTPSIVASDVELAYDETSGEIAFTINNPVETPSVTGAFTSANWISDVSFSLADGKVTFTTTVNNTGAARTATIELKYDVATKIVTVTQAAAPAVISTIPALFAAATSTATDVNVTFDNWVVSGVSTNGKNVFVTDGTNGFVIFSSSDQSNTYAVGNVLSGTAVSCKLQLYNGFAEITNLDASDLTITSGGTVNAAEIAMAELAGVNTGALVSYENLTCSVSSNKYYLSDGTTQLQVYNTLYAFDALEDGKTYNITGIYQQYNSTKEILPRSAADIEEVVSTEPQIVVEATTINLAYNATSGEIPFTIVNPVENASFGAGTIDTPWITNVNAEKIDATHYKVTFKTEANTGEERAATITINYNGVTKDVTVTQAAYVAPADGYYVKVTSTDDLTDGQYLIVYEGNDNHDAVAFNGGLETLDAVGNVIAVTIEEDEIAATNVTRAAEFTIDVAAGTLKSASGYYIGNLSNSNGLSQDTHYDIFAHVFSIDDDGNAVIASHTIDGFIYLRYNYASNQNRFRYYKSGQQAVQLYKFVSSNTVTASVSEYKWATFSSEYDLDFTPVTGLKAYIVTGANGSTILTEQVYKVKAGTGLLLYSETAGDYNIPITTEEVEGYSDNKLIAVTEDDFEVGVPTSGTNYVLTVQEGKVVFAYIGSTPAYLNKGQAYLNLTETSAPYLGFDGEGTTGIMSLTPALSQGEGACYDLSGRRVENPTKGVYIVNGKKVVIK